MKKAELLFGFLLIPLDAAMILLAVIAAYFLRIKLGPEIIYLPPLPIYLKLTIFSLPLWFLIFALAGLYNLKTTKKGYKEFYRIFIACPTAVMLITTAAFLFKTPLFSRLIIVYLLAFSIIFVSFGRFLKRAVQRFLFKYGIGIKKILIIADPLAPLINNLISQFKKPFSGFKILGIISTTHMINSQKDIKVVGKLEDLKKLVEIYKPDEIWLAEDFSSENMLKLIDFIEDKRVGFRFVPSLLAVKTRNTDIDTFGQIPLIEVKRTPLDGWGRIVKRGIDIVGALIGLILTSPLFLIIPILIKLDSEGPVFFRQERVGRDRNFILLKFRTMVKDAEKLHKEYMKKYGVMFKLKDDPRVTRIGRFLRKTSLDELPQLINVLKGEMSLVGPRPPMPEEVEHYSRDQRKRLGIKPGITGLWQVSGRSDIPFDQWVKLDVYYIENWSLWLDFQILLKTIWVILTRKGAY